MLSNRQRKTKDPCPGCFLHRERCICALIPRLDIKTRVTLVVHAKELKRTTNTGRLAVQALVNSEMIVRGASQDGVDLSHLVNPQFTNCVFFPSEDAVDIAEFAQSAQASPLAEPRPIHLIVPDGNWRQASKVLHRHPELHDLPRVKISEKNLSLDHLRKEHMPEGLSTLEAIARALSVLEGADVGDRLQQLYFAKLQATLAGRPPTPTPTLRPN